MKKVKVNKGIIIINIWGSGSICIEKRDTPKAVMY